MFQLTDKPIDIAKLKQQLQQDDCGAMVYVESTVHNQQQHKLTHIHYSVYAALANHQGKKILTNAYDKFDISKAICVQRTGDLTVGDTAIFIGVTAHRHDIAFMACNTILDAIKADLPVWQQAHYTHAPTQWLTAIDE